MPYLYYYKPTILIHSVRVELPDEYESTKSGTDEMFSDLAKNVSKQTGIVSRHLKINWDKTEPEGTIYNMNILVAKFTVAIRPAFAYRIIVSLGIKPQEVVVDLGAHYILDNSGGTDDIIDDVEITVSRFLNLRDTAKLSVVFTHLTQGEVFSSFEDRKCLIATFKMTEEQLEE